MNEACNTRLDDGYPVRDPWAPQTHQTLRIMGVLRKRRCVKYRRWCSSVLHMFSASSMNEVGGKPTAARSAIACAGDFVQISAILVLPSLRVLLWQFAGVLGLPSSQMSMEKKYHLSRKIDRSRQNVSTSTVDTSRWYSTAAISIQTLVCANAPSSHEV